MTDEERKAKERAYQKAYRASHLERKRELANAAHAANPERRRARDKAYREANRNKIRARHAAWQAAHPDRRKTHRQSYRSKNQETLRATNREYSAAHKAQRSAYFATYYADNREKYLAWSIQYNSTHKEQQRAWREINKIALSAKRRAWALAHPEIISARRLKRRAAEQQATPAWANPSAIRAFYMEAARLTEATGIVHEVDHIYPIQGKTVCGLHCESNLQVLPLSENRQKRNKHPKQLGNEPPFTPSHTVLLQLTS